MKIAVSGCGLRTPLLIHGLVHADLPISDIALYDIEPEHAEIMAALGREIASGTAIRIAAAPLLERAVADCSFAISSIRVGGMTRRAQDERLALECGFAGQETTGPAGFAMALRTVPVALQQASLIARVAPGAWIINFTNPAGLITQAISTLTSAHVAGICDTPGELFFRIALALGEPLENVEFDYFGLNHLGWVRAVRVNGEDAMEKLLEDDELLRRLYPAELFPAPLLRTLKLIPTEYVYFYYRQCVAFKNQLKAGTTRGEELARQNEHIWAELEHAVRAGDASAALRTYQAYINRRNLSYMRLEGAGEAAFSETDPGWNPFEGATGYHRIAVDAIRGLCSSKPVRLVLDVPNRDTFPELAPEDVIETPCLVEHTGVRAFSTEPLPVTTHGLIASVKAYERQTIKAAVHKNASLAAMALLLNPIVGQWDAARKFVNALIKSDHAHLGGFGEAF